jgi:predicted RNA-binding Zn-ribbon protein involved in translation (DUF1610 family)
MSIEIRVIRKAIAIECECPKCKEDIQITYDDFTSIVGEPCDWKFSKFHCTQCGEEIEIDSVDWD